MQTLLKDTLRLPKAWLKNWKNRKISDPFDYIFHLKGQLFRQQPGRKTLRFLENGKPYFVKIHWGFSLKEIFKNLFKFQLPIIGASNEITAILQLEKYQFVPKLIGYGFKKFDLKKLNLFSFVITQSLENTVSLEDFCKDWPLSYSFGLPSALPLAFSSPQDFLKFKWALIRKIAKITKIMHDQGINHRDFYLCHFLLKKNPLNQINLFVIDWHRAQMRSTVPLRWRIKDLAGLYFSSMDIKLTQRDLYRFIKIYNFSFNFNHKKNFQKNKRFWQKIKIRALKLYLKHDKKINR